MTVMIFPRERSGALRLPIATGLPQDDEPSEVSAPDHAGTANTRNVVTPSGAQQRRDIDGDPIRVSIQLAASIGPDNEDRFR